MRVTVDTNFLISATQWDNSVAHKLLQAFILGDIQIFATRDILDETAKVLERDFQYSNSEIERILEAILIFTTLIEPKQKVDVIEEDPDDNKIIECTLESGSEYIITYDKHLLNIKEYQGIRIIRPEEARAMY